jgi:hypothetical protein
MAQGWCLESRRLDRVWVLGLPVHEVWLEVHPGGPNAGWSFQRAQNRRQVILLR